MQFTKSIMSLTEMANAGFPREYLNRIVHIRGQKFATRTSRKGKWLFDVEKFEKWKEKNPYAIGTKT